MTLRDVPGPRPVVQHELLHSGMIADLVRDTVDLGEAGVVRREYVRHPGAVAVLAIDEAERVLLVRQYRHPVGAELWELPAGLLDVPGEPQVATAARELAEEADLVAGSWWHLVDYLASPGSSDELVRIFLARDLTDVPHGDRHARTHEEHGMVAERVPLDEAVAAVLDGRVRNPSAVVGLLAAAAARSLGWATLRPAVPDA